MRYLLIAAVLTLVPGSGAWAHEDAKNASSAETKRPAAEETPFGREGDPKKVARTINVDMSDRMRYAPSTIPVRLGETVRFVLRNSGKVMHEFVLGTAQDLTEHAEVMRKHPGMEHDEPYMVHVGPGRTGRVVWQFTRSGDFSFGCLIPGHFEAGMVGTINVSAR